MPRAIVLAVLLSLLSPVPTEANVLCRWIGLCLYLSRGFDLMVVDAETGQPLPGVYAWAEWVQYAAHGTNGPLMIQEATSGPDGRLTFAAWGPRRGSGAGLDLGSDPAVILFKSGYATLVIQNDVPLGADHLAAFRNFGRPGQSTRLERFAGPTTERVRQLRALALSPHMGRVTTEQGAQFRSIYLKRLDLVEAELTKLPHDSVVVTEFRASLKLDRRFWSGDHQ